MKSVLLIGAVALLGSVTSRATTVSFGGKDYGISDGITSRFTTDPGHRNPVDYDNFEFSPSTDASGCYHNGVLTINDNGTDFSEFAQPNTDARGVHLAPKGGASCYLNVGTNAVTDIIYVPSAVTYIGFLLGSPDSYNQFQLIDANGLPVNNSFGGLADSNGILHGDAIIRAATGSYTGDPGNNGTLYVNLQFSLAENISGIRISNNGNCCTEIDNFAYATGTVYDPGSSAASLKAVRPANLVPEPATGFALVAGLGLMGLARRRRG